MVFFIITKAIISLMIVFIMIFSFIVLQDWKRERDKGTRKADDSMAVMVLIGAAWCIAAALSYAAGRI